MRTTITVLILFFAIQLSAQSGITAKELKTHVSYLASDEMKGRKPGTEGGLKSAEYIRNKFKENKLELLGDNGFQYFEVTTGVQLGETNSLKINDFSAKTREDNIPMAISGNGKVESKVVFVGYGFDIDTDSIKWNDYKNVNVKGKWVLILRGDPEIHNRESFFIPYSSERSKVLTAIKNEAAGVLFVSGIVDKKDNLAELKYGRGNAQMKIPVIHIKRQLADKILEKSKTNIETLEAELIENKKSNSLKTKAKVSAEVNINYIKVKTQNVVAMRKSNNKKFSNEYIIVGGHYDHLGMGGENSGSRMPDSIAVHNGADDNASGIASILELSEEFAKRKSNNGRNIIFVAFGAEEMGLLGSSYFVNNSPVDLKSINCMINLDMVGRLDEKEPSITIAGTGTAEEFNTFLDKNEPESINFSYSPGGYGSSDHSSFYMKDIPVLFFNTGAHADYHTPLDDIETLNYKGQEELTKLIFEITNQLSIREEALTFKETAGKATGRKHGRGYKVTLGIIPGYGDDSNTGLRIDGVRSGGPAEIGGMKKGDRIVAINGEEVLNIYDYMEFLGKLSVGQNATVDVMRGDKKVILLIKL